MIDHRFVMLKPMKPGVSGYARIQSEAGATSVLVSARGLRTKGVRVFWYGGGGEALELASARVGARGEVTLAADWPAKRLAPERLQALLIASDDPAPTPLMIGLCVPQSAGSLLDAKNALLALCERLGRERRAQREDGKGENKQRKAAADGGQPREASRGAALPAPTGGERRRETQSAAQPAASATPSPAAAPPEKARAPMARAVRVKPRALEPTREIFLTAIDPLPYVQAEVGKRPETLAAMERAPSVKGDASPSQAEGEAAGPAPAPQVRALPRSARPPADRLPRLRWPEAFASLAPYFDSLPPRAPLYLPGWRFVEAREGLFIGRLAADGRVRRIAYAFRADAPPDGERPYQPLRGTDGKIYQVLWQRVG